LSDIQASPEWWLASDGKWYPPQSRAATQPVAPQLWPGATGAYAPVASYQTYIQSRPTVSPALAGWLQGILWVTAAIAAVAAVIGVNALTAFDRFWEAPIDSRAEERAYDQWIGADDALNGATGLMMLTWIAAFVLLLVWMNKAHKATQTLSPGPRAWSSGWTIGGWFIPLAQFVIPKLVLNEVERIVTAPRSSGVVNPNWRQQSTSALGWLWWVAFSAAAILVSVGSGILAEDPLLITDSEIRTGYTIQAIGLACGAIGCSLGALFVRSLSRRLSPQGLAA
jgi:hypothetical protein